MKNKMGFSFIEIMMTLLLSVIILKLFFNYYELTIRHYKQEIDSIRKISTAEKILSMLKKEIQLAGWSGCVSLHNGLKVKDYDGYSYRLNSIFFSQQQHQLKIVYADPNGIDIESIPDEKTLIINYNNKLKVNDYIIILDCYGGEINKILSISHHGTQQIIVLAKPLQNKYLQAIVTQLIKHDFFLVASYQADNQLYMRNVNNKKIKLEDNIADLNFYFTSKVGNSLQDLSYEQINDWSLIQGVKIELKMNIRDKTKTWFAYVNKT